MSSSGYCVLDLRLISRIRRWMLDRRMVGHLARCIRAGSASIPMRHIHIAEGWVSLLIIIHQRPLVADLPLHDVFRLSGTLGHGGGRPVCVVESLWDVAWGGHPSGDGWSCSVTKVVLPVLDAVFGRLKYISGVAEIIQRNDEVAPHLEARILSHIGDPTIPVGVSSFLDLRSARDHAVEVDGVVLGFPDVDYVVVTHDDVVGGFPREGGLSWFIGRGWGRA